MPKSLNSKHIKTELTLKEQVTEEIKQNSTDIMLELSDEDVKIEKKYRGDINDLDLKTLDGKNWLNDKVINEYILSLADQF